MKRVLIIGCPGSGKSTFARRLRDITGLPLYYLDMIYHKADGSVLTSVEFDARLSDILIRQSWIIDGNYMRTLSHRLMYCDTVFWLDYPIEVCLSGIADRRGKRREDMPCVKPERDLTEYIKEFAEAVRPEIEKLFINAEGKHKVRFSSRDEADKFLETLISD